MVTDKQIAALKHLIFRAKDGTDLTKRILVFLIENSEKLAQEVCLTLLADREGYSAEEIQAAAYGMSGMQSCNGTTHLHELFTLMGSDLNSDLHYGDFDPTRAGDPFSAAGQFAGAARIEQVTHPDVIREGMPLRYTFWLSKKRYSRQAKFIVATREELEKIDLKRPGLYEHAERLEAV